ncbi:hypothetical protein LY78DRAFT_380726 [Colletotrichum sublineola]|nr:hypothetical protein LY78DRAFT_380726 [Colletotrichum sublineola]
MRFLGFCRWNFSLIWTSTLTLSPIKARSCVRPLCLCLSLSFFFFSSSPFPVNVGATSRGMVSITKAPMRARIDVLHLGNSAIPAMSSPPSAKNKTSHVFNLPT